MSLETSYDAKCEILCDLWTDYKTFESLQEFISYNDVGLPLAYATYTGIVESTPQAEGYIIDTFENLLTYLDIKDEGFSSTDEVFTAISDE